jgi:hypothetical protein
MTRIICTHVLFLKLVKQTQDIGSANATQRRTPTSSNSIVLLIEPGRHRQRRLMRKLTESDLMILFIEPGNANHGVGVSPRRIMCGLVMEQHSVHFWPCIQRPRQIDIVRSVNSLCGIVTHDFKVFIPHGLVKNRLNNIIVRMMYSQRAWWYKDIISWSVYCPLKVFSRKQADPLASITFTHREHAPENPLHSGASLAHPVRISCSCHLH